MTCSGVSKSGSPTPRLMTSVIVAMMSKKRRMPDRGTSSTRRARTRVESGGRSGSDSELRIEGSVVSRLLPGWVVGVVIGVSSGLAGTRGGRALEALLPLDRAGRVWIVGQLQLGGLEVPPGCSGRDRFVRAGQTEHRKLAHGAPMIWRPTGRPSDRPAGIDIPGRPAMLTGRVQASERYMATGSFILAPMGKATVGLAGAQIASKPAAQTASKSDMMRVRTFCALR